MLSNKLKYFTIILSLFFLSSCSFSTYNVKPLNIPCPKNEYVVVLHGIFIGNYQMDSLANYLAESGYDVINIAYPSTSYDLQDLTQIIKKDVEAHIVKNQKVHFVGFSMGGILARTLLKEYRPEQLGRVVQIASPNKGSEVADFVKDIWLFKQLFGPAGQELTTNQESINHLFGPVDYELGIIAGQNTFNITFQLLFDSKNDGIVAVDKAIIKEAKDIIILNGSHSLMPLDADVQKQVLSFIEQGKFIK